MHESNQIPLPIRKRFTRGVCSAEANLLADLVELLLSSSLLYSHGPLVLDLMVGFVSVFICFCRIGRLEPVCVRASDLANGPLRTFDPVDFFSLHSPVWVSFFPLFFFLFF